jgi:hypothetical protein
MDIFTVILDLGPNPEPDPDPILISDPATFMQIILGQGGSGSGSTTPEKTCMKIPTGTYYILAYRGRKRSIFSEW